MREGSYKPYPPNFPVFSQYLKNFYFKLKTIVEVTNVNVLGKCVNKIHKNISALPNNK